MLISIKDFSVASLHDVETAMIDHDKLTKQQLEEISKCDSPSIIRKGEVFIVGKTRIELNGLPDDVDVNFLMIIASGGVLRAWRVKSSHPSFDGVHHPQVFVGRPGVFA